MKPYILLALCLFISSCGKLNADKEKIDSTFEGEDPTVKTSDLTGSIGSFAGSWGGSARLIYGRRSPTEALVLVNIAQSANSIGLIFKIQGKKADEAYLRDLGGFSISENTLVSAQTANLSGRIGSSGFILSDVNTGEEFRFKRTDQGLRFEAIAQQKEASGKKTSMRIKGELTPKT